MLIIYENVDSVLDLCRRHLCGFVVRGHWCVLQREMASLIGRLAGASRALVPVVARSTGRQIVPIRNAGNVT